MRRYLAVFVLLGAFFLGACGGGDSDAKSDDKSSGDAAGTSEEGSGAADDTDFSGKGSKDFCAKVKYLDENDALNADAEGEEAQRKQAKDALDALGDLQDEAPGEIEADVDTLVEALRPLLQAVADGKDLANMTPEEQKKFEAIDSDKVDASSKRVNSYVEKVCKIDTDEDGDTDGIIEDDSSTTTDDSTTSTEP